MDIDVVNLLDFDARAHRLVCPREAVSCRQVLRWVHRHGATDFDQMTDVAKSLRQAKPQRRPQPPVPVRSRPYDRWHAQVVARRRQRQRGRDGVHPEPVAAPCASSQAGCASTALLLHQQAGLQPQPPRRRDHRVSCGSPTLGANGDGEQVISNVVMMGMGEPSPISTTSCRPSI